MLVGTSRVLLRREPRPRIVAFEPATSSVLTGGKAGTHGVEGVAPGFVPPQFDRAVGSEARGVGETEARRTAWELPRREGIFAGPGAGSDVAGTPRIADRRDRLEAAGVAPADVQQSLRDIVTQVTDRGPGGHILTGPVYVEGADSGDVLEVRILRIALAISYGYNGCRGFLPDNCDSTSTTRIIPLDRRRMEARGAQGTNLPPAPPLAILGGAPAADARRVSGK